MNCRVHKGSCSIAVFAGLLLAGAASAGEGIKAIVTPIVGEVGQFYWAVPANKAPGDPAVVYLSADRGATWDASVPVPTNMSEPPSITHVAHSFDYVYVGTEAEGVFRTANGRDWEKWNEADVGIVEMKGYAPFGWIGAITTDGATFTGGDTGSGITFTQIYEVPLTATALHMNKWGLLGVSMSSKIGTHLAKTSSIARIPSRNFALATMRSSSKHWLHASSAATRAGPGQNQPSRGGKELLGALAAPAGFPCLMTRRAWKSLITLSGLSSWSVMVSLRSSLRWCSRADGRAVS